MYQWLTAKHFMQILNLKYFSNLRVKNQWDGGEGQKVVLYVLIFYDEEKRHKDKILYTAELHKMAIIPMHSTIVR